MSIRQYHPKRNSRRGIGAKSSLLLKLIFLIAILLQVAYPLVNGETLRWVTTFTVYFGAGAMLLHALFSFGFRYFLTFGFVTFIFALGIEQIGSRTSWPFGSYTYSQTLGAQISGVPVIVPFAWIMLSHPILIASRKLTTRWVFLYGGLGLMAWDLFLDPQMVEAGRWIWKLKGPSVPFESNIPLSNAVGWLLSGMGLMAILNLVLPKERRKNGANSFIPDFLLGWTLFSGIVGNLFFFHRPGVAIIGGVVMGILLAPYFFAITLGKPDNR
jgi:uncharacterized membrane protein